jgi:hypothetical protein
MDNIKYINAQKSDDVIELYFRIHPTIADFIRKNTDYSEDELESSLSKDNIYIYRVACSDKFEAVRDSVVEVIEKISNEGDDERFYNHILTDNGKRKSPRKFHAQMENKYSLKADTEWWVAHFFIGLSDLLFSPDDEELIT